jgi:uroporphyrin-III C-methyltransferase
MSKVYLVGAGPGDPELLTVKAWRLLQRADVVLYDRLVSPEVLEVVNPRAHRIYLGKHEGQQQEIQEQIYSAFLRFSGNGGGLRRTIVRLKGGDPMVFGRGGEEWMFLAAHGIAAEVVPGVSSSVAVPALAGIPLTFRGVSQSFTVVTGHCQKGAPEWTRYAAAETLVVLMGVKHRAEIAQALIDAGRPTDLPAAFIERGSTPEERVVVTTLGDVARGEVEVESPAVFVIGEVVNLRSLLVQKQYEWDHLVPVEVAGVVATAVGVEAA